MDLVKFEDGGFNLTTERFQFIQATYTNAMSQLASGLGLAVNQVGVLSGVDGIGTLSDGVVVYNNEVMPFVSGDSSETLVIVEEFNQVRYNVDENNDGLLDERPSEVIRYMTFSGTVSENMTEVIQDEPLFRLPSIKNLMPVVGEIKMFEGSADDVPNGWEIMEEMNGAFPVGTSVVGGDFSVGQEGGANSRNIFKANLPNYTLTGTTGSGGGHRHDYVDGYYIESSPAGSSRQDQLDGYDSESVGTGFRGSSSTDTDNTHIWTKDRVTSFQSSHTHSMNINSGGSGIPLDMKPKHKAFYFIKFVGF